MNPIPYHYRRLAFNPRAKVHLVTGDDSRISWCGRDFSRDITQRVPVPSLLGQACGQCQRILNRLQRMRD